MRARFVDTALLFRTVRDVRPVVAVHIGPPTIRVVDARGGTGTLLRQCDISATARLTPSGLSHSNACGGRCVGAISDRSALSPESRPNHVGDHAPATCNYTDPANALAPR